jgi:uncharacterized protein with HEPN domain
MSPRDLVYVGHMLDMARKAVAKTRGLAREAYDADENLRLALIHLVQVIGEAARQVSNEFAEAHPDIPWTNIIGMRHKVVHDYLGVDEDIVWQVVTVDLPKLVSAIESLVPPAS